MFSGAGSLPSLYMPTKSTSKVHVTHIYYAAGVVGIEPTYDGCRLRSISILRNRVEHGVKSEKSVSYYRCLTTWLHTDSVG